MMQKRFVILMIACILLLAACAGLAASDPVPPAVSDLMSLAEPEARQETAYEAPAYEIVPVTFGNQFREDEEVIALYNYQIVTLSLRNQEAVSPEDAERVERNIEAFNSKMQAVGEGLVEQGKEMAADAKTEYAENGPLASEYEDGATVDVVFCGDVLSACLHRASYTGGAHPNRYTVSYLFDLSAGQFIDPTQIAEDPEAFRTGAAELLLEKAEAHEARDEFWEDYAEVIAHWNEGTVQFFDEGMRVTYSPYELGPYSMGEVELLLDWEELEALIGPGGLERLGRESGD